MGNNNVSKKGIAGYWLVMLFVVVSFAIVFITAGILYFLQAPASFESFERTAKNWDNRIVKVISGNEISTGFVMESKREDDKDYVYIITSYHGVDGDTANVNIILNGENHKAENLSWNDIIDVAVFKIECNEKYSLPTIADESVGTEVMALGYAEGITLCAETGYVNSVDYLDVNANLNPLLCYDVSAYVRSGMSGCPVLTKDGKIIGMGVRTKVDNIEGEEVHFSSDNYVVPYSVMLSEYDRALNHRTASYARYYFEKESMAILVNIGEASVVYNGTLTLDNEKILKVNGKNVESFVDFMAKISLYSNRNANGEVTVTTAKGDFALKVVNE